MLKVSGEAQNGSGIREAFLPPLDLGKFRQKRKQASRSHAISCLKFSLK
jgi:hypothetical protein